MYHELCDREETCKNSDCRMWLESSEDNNCCLNAVNNIKRDERGIASEREIADKMGCTYQNISGILVSVFEKIKNKEIGRELKLYLEEVERQSAQEIITLDDNFRISEANYL